MAKSKYVMVDGVKFYISPFLRFPPRARKEKHTYGTPCGLPFELHSCRDHIKCDRWEECQQDRAGFMQPPKPGNHHDSHRRIGAMRVTEKEDLKDRANDLFKKEGQ